MLTAYLFRYTSECTISQSNFQNFLRLGRQGGNDPLTKILRTFLVVYRGPVQQYIDVLRLPLDAASVRYETLTQRDSVDTDPWDMGHVGSSISRVESRWVVYSRPVPVSLSTASVVVNFEEINLKFNKIEKFENVRNSHSMTIRLDTGQTSYIMDRNQLFAFEKVKCLVDLVVRFDNNLIFRDHISEKKLTKFTVSQVLF